MKVSKAQMETLKQLTEPLPYSSHHPKQAYKLNTLDALQKKGLVEFYNYSGFLHGAVRITKNGREVINN
jgi:hypothetical protein